MKSLPKWTRHFRPSFNRKPNGLGELRRDLMTNVMLGTRTPMALRLNELLRQCLEVAQFK